MVSEGGQYVVHVSVEQTTIKQWREWVAESERRGAERAVDQQVS